MSRCLNTSIANRYYPLDELLEMPRVRILRALYRFDWASGMEIRIALDIEDDREANAHQRTMLRMVDAGLVERIGHRWTTYRYRITAKGKLALRAMLARGTVADVEARS